MSLSRHRWLCLAAALALCAALPAFGQRVSRQQLRDWTSLLKSEDPQKRSAAATSLLATNDSDALDALLEALKPDKPEAGRISVITAFGVKGDDRACPQIIAALADPGEAVRLAARSALLSINTPQAVAQLRQAAAEVKRPLTIRVQAIGLLGELREIEAIQALIPLLTDREEAVRTAARNALKSITLRDFNTAAEWKSWGQEHLNMTRAQMLEELVQLQDARIRSLSGAVERLYKRMLDDPKVQTDAAVLVEALTQCDSPAVKKSAIKWLTAQRSEPVRTALINALTEPDASVRQAAADALGAQADPAAAPALLKALGDAEIPVRASAAHALGLLKAKNKDIVPALSAMLGDPSVDAAVAAADALAELADPAALDKLINVVTAPATPPQLYDAAANALAKIQDPRAVPIFVKLLKSPKEKVRWASVDALGGLRAVEAVKPLSDVALHDPIANIREAALAALSKIGDPAALDTLVDALSDDQKRVAEHAMSSLIQLADANAARYQSALDRLLAAGRYALAESVLTAALAQFADKPGGPQDAAGLRAYLAAGFMAAKEWARARAQYEALLVQSPKEARYVKGLVACLSAQADCDALLAFLSQTRKAAPDLVEYAWQQTLAAVEQLAAGTNTKKVVTVVDAIEKESPDLGGPVIGPKLRALRKAALDKPAVPAPAPGPAPSRTAAPPA